MRKLAFEVVSGGGTLTQNGDAYTSI